MLAEYVRGLQDSAVPFANFACIPEAQSASRADEGLYFEQVRLLALHARMLLVGVDFIP